MLPGCCVKCFGPGAGGRGSVRRPRTTKDARDLRDVDGGRRCSLSVGCTVQSHSSASPVHRLQRESRSTQEASTHGFVFCCGRERRPCRRMLFTRRTAGTSQWGYDGWSCHLKHAGDLNKYGPTAA